MDHMMPGIDGIEATRRLHAYDPSIRVVVLGEAHDDALGLRAIQAGAVGFLSKEIDLDALPRVLRGVRDGEAAISRRFATTLIENYRVSNRSGTGLRPVRSRLTPREWEVLDLLTTGLTADQIAASLVLSTETIRSHVKSIYRKLDVHTRPDAIREASRLRSRIVHATDRTIAHATGVGAVVADPAPAVDRFDAHQTV
jgi:NarL family two-component system response regulator LiaR